MPWKGCLYQWLLNHTLLHISIVKNYLGGDVPAFFFFNEKLFLGRATKNSECILYSKSNLWFVKFLFQLFLGMSEPWYRMYFRLRSWSKPHCLSVQMTALRHGKFLSQGFNYVPAYCLRNSTVYWLILEFPLKVFLDDCQFTKITLPQWPIL